MSYISFEYLLIFLPMVILLYTIVARKYRYLILLLASYIFFMIYSDNLVIVLLITTLSIYLSGRLLEKNQIEYKNKTIDKTAYQKKRKKIVTILIIANLAIIGLFKYYNFFSLNINRGFSFIGSPLNLASLNLVMPIGISFYTMQGISYVIDVYRGKIKAEHNFLKLALFQSFFPTIVEGPIVAYSDMEKKLSQNHDITYNNLCFGIQRIVWGIFKNMVIADRLNMLVRTVFNNYNNYSGIVIIVAAIAYTFQLYMNFYGTIDVSIGVAKIFDIELTENFKQPFFSKTTLEFWQRWHITLGTWFKEYVFYSVSLSKFSKNLNKKMKNRFGKYYGSLIPVGIALLAVWLCNGLWHGAKWSYIFFGLYYFGLIMLGKICEPIVSKVTTLLKIDRKSRFYSCFQSVKLLIIVFIGELFFRADSFLVGVKMFLSIFRGFSFKVIYDGTLLNIGLEREDFVVVILALLLVLWVSYKNEKGYDLYLGISNLKLPYRWFIYYGMILVIVIFGAYGVGYLTPELIYAGF